MAKTIITKTETTIASAQFFLASRRNNAHFTPLYAGDILKWDLTSDGLAKFSDRDADYAGQTRVFRMTRYAIYRGGVKVGIVDLTTDEIKREPISSTKADGLQYTCIDQEHFYDPINNEFMAHGFYYDGGTAEELDFHLRNGLLIKDVIRPIGVDAKSIKGRVLIFGFTAKYEPKEPEKPASV